LFSGKVPVKKVWKDACLGAAKEINNQRQRGPLLALLPVQKTATVVEAKLLLQTCCAVKPSADPTVATYIIQVMHCVRRLGIHELYPNLVQPLKRTWDAALTWQVQEEYKAEQSNHSFMRTYGGLVDICHGSLKDDIITLVTTCTDESEYKNYLVPLMNCASGARFSKNMFGWAVPRAVDGYMEQFCQRLCVFPADRPLSQDDINGMIAACLAEAERLKIDEVSIILSK